jgi:uroporphyrinogen-III synthase
MLAEALAAPVVVFTSPAAVRAAHALGALHPAPGAHWLAVGEGSARALRRAGVSEVAQPARMDSEGLLALPTLVTATRVGLVTAPGGRGLIAGELARRGTPVVRADVYERVALPLPAATVQRLRALDGPTVLALSSGEALARVLDQLPADLLARWQAHPVVAASERLAALAAERGFHRILRAEGPRPAQLLAAATTST